MIEPIISVIIPVHYGAERHLRHCLNSIFDQDHGQVEVIVVQDGSCETVESTVAEYVNVKLLKTGPECRGAPVARNMGAKASMGDVLIFPDADTTFLPGAFSIYVKALEKHPEAAFVYTGYRFVNGTVLPTQEFDPYLLETRNYISGTQPIRREWFPGWDENLASLQDWDLWLSIVKDKGGVGVYLPDIPWVTELPRHDGLSGDQSRHWLDRMEYIKKKHGIPERDICVCSLAAPQHGLRLAKILDADFNNEPYYRPYRYRLILVVGFFSQTSGGVGAHQRLIMNRNPDCKTAVYFIGSDVLQLRALPHDDFKAAVDFFKIEFDQRLVEYETLRAEVEDELGIPVEVLPHPIDAEMFPPTPYPETFTVGIYHGLSGVHMLGENIRLAGHMPDVNFLIYGPGGLTQEEAAKLPPNVEHLGQLEYPEGMNRFYDSIHCLLRTTTHDGFSVSHCEAVLKGRHVISTMPHRPGALCVPNNASMISDAVRRVQAMVRDKAEPDDERLAMSDLYAELLDPGKWVERIRSIID